MKPIFIGGYVKIAGMNPYEENPPEDTPRLYGSKPIWQRAITIFAGPGSALRGRGGDLRDLARWSSATRAPLRSRRS